MSFAATQMDLETVILSEEVKDRQISYDMAYMWNLKTIIQVKFFTKQK